MRILCILILLGLNGCTSASLVSYPAGPGSKNSPANEKSREGVVKYLSVGSESRIQARRMDAYKKMAESCNTKYKIVHEETAGGDSFGEYGHQYHVIAYQCEP